MSCLADQGAGTPTARRFIASQTQQAWICLAMVEPETAVLTAREPDIKDSFDQPAAPQVLYSRAAQLIPS
jgi:hypothetical protein